MAKKTNKQVKHREVVEISKKPKHNENPDSFLEKKPVWSFRLVDNNYHKWGLIHCGNLNRNVISKLIDYEGMTWDEIMKASGGRTKGNNNHYEDIASLCKEAQRRWISLKLEEYDKVFSLRMTAEMRLYGILMDGIFKIVWFDQEHEIYPVSKK